MYYSLHGSAVQKNHNSRVFACLAACALLGLGYLQVINNLLLLPVRLPGYPAPVPVLFESTHTPVPIPKAGGLAALTPINMTPLSKLMPKTGQRWELQLSKIDFMSKTGSATTHKAHRAHLLSQIHRAKTDRHTTENRQSEVIDIKPGGRILVLALLIDPSGVIVRIKVLVPSKYPLMDLNYTLWMVGESIGKPNPPIPAGHTRWVTLNIKYRNRHPKVALP